MNYSNLMKTETVYNKVYSFFKVKLKHHHEHALCFLSFWQESAVFFFTSRGGGVVLILVLLLGQPPHETVHTAGVHLLQ